MHGGETLQQIEIDLRGQDLLTVYIDVFEHDLARRWLAAVDHLLQHQYHLEKNYCFHGFVQHRRDGTFILDEINRSIAAINSANIGYHINDHFDMAEVLTDDPVDHHVVGRNIRADRFNRLHRYFEDLQGQHGAVSAYYTAADAVTRWHIRQLNLLCHEFESWALSYRKEIEAPEWRRPSQLMCWLNAPRFALEPQDLELFGIHTLNRPLGGVFVGVNKSVGKHHWEVYRDEGRDSRIDELVTGALISQTLASGDFDIEWARDPAPYDWRHQELEDFRHWLTVNGFDPKDPELTIGHPQVAQVDLDRSFGTQEPELIWQQLSGHLDVIEIRTARHRARYDYCWSDADYAERQIEIINKGT